ncbi:hypothetical protein M433DRAFT_154027 [Acidomyces richmondensis BFW]|nr:hypothetical protein M433DRAFT_154027 [Acidomyces richmondensis BFW]
MPDQIALLCLLQPASLAKQERCLDLLRRAARLYYRGPESQCTAWTYFLPYPSPKTQGDELIIGGLEIYTSKTALQAQLEDPVFFQPYHDTVKREGLYRHPEELVAWYYAAGFVARGEHSERSLSALISVSRMICSDKTQVLDLLGRFSVWVKDNEPDVLTYVAFQRPKAPKDVLLFVRYRDDHAMKAHSAASEHVQIVKQLSKLLEGNLGKGTTIWKEIEESFVSTIPGGDESIAPSKL